MAAQINTFTEVLEKAQRIEIAGEQVRDFHAKRRGAPGGSQGAAQNDRHMPPLKSVVELEVEGLQVHLEEVLRREPKVEGDKGEASHREARHPSPKYHIGIVGSRTIPRTIAEEKLENV